MSNRSREAKVAFSLEMIDNIEKIIHHHQGIVKALYDYEVNMVIIEDIIHLYLPQLKAKIVTLGHDHDPNTPQ